MSRPKFALPWKTTTPAGTEVSAVINRKVIRVPDKPGVFEDLEKQVKDARRADRTPAGKS